jgi:hypothetical protein
MTGSLAFARIRKWRFFSRRRSEPSCTAGRTWEYAHAPSNWNRGDGTEASRRRIARAAVTRENTLLKRTSCWGRCQTRKWHNNWDAPGGPFRRAGYNSAYRSSTPNSINGRRRKRSWLGTLTDGEVAKRIGVTLSAVAHRRRRIGRGVRHAHRRTLDAGGRRAVGDGQRHRDSSPFETTHRHRLHSPTKTRDPQLVLAETLRTRA